MSDSALNTVKYPKVNVLIDGTDLESWEVRTAWDDSKLALEHGNERDALFGHNK